jgi:hypothetical protein
MSANRPTAYVEPVYSTYGEIVAARIVSLRDLEALCIGRPQDEFLVTCLREREQFPIAYNNNRGAFEIDGVFGYKTRGATTFPADAAGHRSTVSFRAASQYELVRVYFEFGADQIIAAVHKDRRPRFLRVVMGHEALGPGDYYVANSGGIDSYEAKLKALIDAEPLKYMPVAAQRLDCTVADIGGGIYLREWSRTPSDEEPVFPGYVRMFNGVVREDDRWLGYHNLPSGLQLAMLSPPTTRSSVNLGKPIERSALTIYRPTTMTAEKAATNIREKAPTAASDGIDLRLRWVQRGDPWKTDDYVPAAVSISGNAVSKTWVRFRDLPPEIAAKKMANEGHEIVLREARLVYGLTPPHAGKPRFWLDVGEKIMPGDVVVEDGGIQPAVAAINARVVFPERIARDFSGVFPTFLLTREHKKQLEDPYYFAARRNYELGLEGGRRIKVEEKEPLTLLADIQHEHEV